MKSTVGLEPEYIAARENIPQSALAEPEPEPEPEPGPNTNGAGELPPAMRQMQDAVQQASNGTAAD
jgi:hypothetical protein